MKSRHRAKTSSADGASLDAKLIYPLGKKLANVKNVKVELPKQLPSRLTTLQQACPDHVFRRKPRKLSGGIADRAGEGEHPDAAQPLEGWAYFVSHGGAAFPNLVVVLQDRPDGVRVDLVGETFISKAGITSTTFGTVPDVPISEFELYLPEGPNSALAANGNLCTAKDLVMPTIFNGQNGVTLQQNTRITVEGCKPSLIIIGHHSNGGKAMLVVSVPEAGKLTLQGTGLTATSTSASSARNVTLKVKLTKEEVARLTRHHGRKRLVTARLTFTSKDGKTLTATTKVAIG